MKESKLSLSKSVIIVMLSILVSRATGFIKEMLVPNTLGVGVIGDAYNVSIMVPEILYNLLIGGAIASALIPVLTYYLENKKYSVIPQIKESCNSTYTKLRITH